MSMKEVEIKRALLNDWRQKKFIDCSTTLASEYVLHKQKCRADLAIYNGRFRGIEIKSARDTLCRLDAQLQAYSRCFDEVILVVDESHTSKINRKNDCNIEIWQISACGLLTKIRSPDIPESSPLTRAQLGSLKLKELRQLTGIEEKFPRRELLKFAEQRSGDEIRAAVINSFCNAFASVSRSFWQANRRKKISLQQVASLSRFAQRREWWQAQVAELAARRKAWDITLPNTVVDPPANLNQPTPPRSMLESGRLPVRAGVY